MSEKLSEKRCRFTDYVTKLVMFCNTTPGYRCALNEVKRSSAQARANAAQGIGISNSLHLLGLAVDLILYKEGVYQEDSVAYEFLGRFWKGLSPDCAWGGDFSRPDGNHFSIEHNGVK